MVRQPVPTVTSEDVDRIVRRDFPAAQTAEALAVLMEYGREEWHRAPDRVRLAALKLAGGDLDGLRRAIESAKLDDRDVLAAAEYPEYLRCIDPSGRMAPSDEQRIVDADWKQYCEWLAR